MRGRRIAVTVLAAALLAAAVGGFLMSFFNARWLAAAQAAEFGETAEQLDNPDRGFYLIHGFPIRDDLDAATAVEQHFAGDTGHALALVELNLSRYTGGEVSDAGLSALDALFDALRETGMHFIVRFVYDWDGKNMETEPQTRAVVERHMAQTGPLLRKNADIIYTLQGLYVGNWGEMNGTRYTGAEHWRALARSLWEATGGDLWLSVRMPMQWRSICAQSEADAAAPGLRDKLGLFNDGMLGSESDLGTYGSARRDEASFDSAWRREDELDFVDTLCRAAPNGGEAVQGADELHYQDALTYLRKTHVSYLNEDYDRRVLDRWAAETVRGGVWDGTDGLSYIRAHLGYRFTVTAAQLNYQLLSNRLNVAVTLENRGFAPIAFPVQPWLILRLDAGDELRLALEGDIASLCDKPLDLTAALPLGEIPPGDYQLFLLLEYERGAIACANDTRQTDGAIPIGGITAK